MRTIFFAAAVALVGCASSATDTASSGAAILGGTLDASLPAVGYVVAGGSVVCTATLIAPTLALTAGHCAGLADDYEFGWGQVPAHTTVKVSSIAVHPRYIEPTTDGGEDVQGYDIALMQLETAPPLTPLTPLAATPSSGAALALGYGSTSYAPDASGNYQATGAGTDRKSTGESIVSINPVEVYAQSADGSSTCYGDSGSPLLVGNQVVGVLSRFTGETRCLPEDHTVMAYTRTEGMDSFFTQAKACFGNADIEGCLRQPATHLCPSAEFTNAASPGNVAITQGDATNGSSMFTLSGGQELGVRFTAPTAQLHLQIFSDTDARMTVKRVNGGMVGAALDEATLDPGAQYDVIVDSCNETQQLVTLVWSPAAH